MREQFLALSLHERKGPRKHSLSYVKDAVDVKTHQLLDITRETAPYTVSMRKPDVSQHLPGSSHDPDGAECIPVHQDGRGGRDPAGECLGEAVWEQRARTRARLPELRHHGLRMQAGSVKRLS